MHIFQFLQCTNYLIKYLQLLHNVQFQLMQVFLLFKSGKIRLHSSSTYKNDYNETRYAWHSLYFMEGILYWKDLIHQSNSTKFILVKNIALKTVMSGSTEKSSTSTEVMYNTENKWFLSILWVTVILIWSGLSTTVIKSDWITFFPPFISSKSENESFGSS